MIKESVYYNPIVLNLICDNNYLVYMPIIRINSIPKKWSQTKT